MKKSRKIIILSIVAAAVLTALILLIMIPKKKQAIAQIQGVYELRGAYRNAASVICARCLENYTASNLVERSTFVVEEVVSGNSIKSGEIVSVIGRFEKGASMILYLSEPVTELYQSEVDAYNVINDAAYAIKNDSIKLHDGVSVTIDQIKEDIKELEKEIMIPSRYLYSDNIGGVMEHSDNIFIGKVQKVEVNEEADVYSIDHGEETHRKSKVYEITVEVTDGLIWWSYEGDIVKIIMTDDDYDNIYSAKTEDHFDSTVKYNIPSVGNEYLFFLINSPDKKCSNMFFLNMYQGFIRKIEKNTFPNSENEPFKDYTKMSDLIIGMFEAIELDYNYFDSLHEIVLRYK